MPDGSAGRHSRGHQKSHFFPWQMRQDGHGLETLNHIGRHELTDCVREARTDDPNVVEYGIWNGVGRTNPNVLRDMFHVKEDPTRPGRYIGTQAVRFGTQTARPVRRPPTRWRRPDPDPVISATRSKSIRR